ncbi:LLM class flavin-dependent oxidoreductase [Sporichthya sp.]|uniref:LLM class flavin-dependent oxidoreductase n=1 Tax=Sporichthya sp. TaxID=65475 RepID=UPI0018509F2B|nr:LLM class flavin-dependent oxidoreductase [Sporichthya sp.]MBA3741428.1 LLM class flavin-dependent oxidoreductase [Sporichthya sp.]
MPTASLTPADLFAVCEEAHGLGYRSLWLGDHVVLPRRTESSYPHTAGGSVPFSAETPWLDPLLTLGWLSARLPPTMRIGTSVLILPLRNPVLLAKQLTSLSWLTERPISLGVGSGWLREEYDAIGAPFEKRASAARSAIGTIRELYRDGGADFTVRGPDNVPTLTPFTLLPPGPGPLEFLWGGVSPAALRLVAAVCDGWLPAKQPLDALPPLVDALRAACDAAGRDFSELRLVAKPGPGPDPESGAIDAAGLDRYAALGFSELILEMPYESGGPGPAIEVLRRVAERADM